jgi:hypothetical protein
VNEQKFEDTKEVIKCSKSKKDRQHNDQRKANKMYRPLVNHPPILSASVLTWLIRHIFLSKECGYLIKYNNDKNVAITFSGNDAYLESESPLK